MTNGKARVYHGRMKGCTDIHIPNNKTREGHDSMEWSSPQLCEECWNKPCTCSSKVGEESIE